MRLLREYIRELLREGAKGPKDLPAGVDVVINSTGNRVVIAYSDGSGEITIQRTDFQRKKYGECDGAWMVSWVEAKSGWGPLLYDLAIEWASENGGGLTADRVSVSPAARKVWDYYLTKRSDVNDHQLDNPDNTLTAYDNDNCDQTAAAELTSWWRRRGNFQKSPLSKRYTKSPTAMNMLRSMGRLKEQ